jgi:hypothetical protein
MRACLAPVMRWREPGGRDARPLDHGRVDDRRAAGAGHASRPVGGAATPRVCTLSCGVGGATANVAARQCTSGCTSRWRRIADGVRRAGGLTYAVDTFCCHSDEIGRAVHSCPKKNGSNAITQWMQHLCEPATLLERGESTPVERRCVLRRVIS